jgi:TatD DNase family protein
MITPRLVDAHAHLNFAAFNDDRAEVIKRTLEAGVWHINVGTKKDTSRQAVELAEQYDQGVYAIVGLHPIHTARSYHDEAELGEKALGFTSAGEDFDYDDYLQLARRPKVVGIGECGLDYFRADPAMVIRQKEIFSSQIRLANEVQKPLMLHIRSGDNQSAYAEALAILKAQAKVLGNAHFFAGTIAEAKSFLDLGFYLSFTGVITFAKDYAELVRFVPLDRILIETDCPYVAPAPYRGKRNEPLYVTEVAKRVAELKGLSLLQVTEDTTANCRRLFRF